MAKTSPHRNDGIRKICGCPRRQWAKCPHPWHFNFKVPGGTSYRFSLDREVGHPIKTKGEAKGRPTASATKSAPAFGDELENEIKDTKKAWQTRVLKAHEPEIFFVEGTHDLGLHFHDLRREAASRLLEKGLPLHHVSKLLGHANIATTSIYLSATDADLQRAFDAVDPERTGSTPAAPPVPEPTPASATIN